MNRHLCLALLLTWTCAAAFAAKDGARPATAELEKITQELMDAIAPGHKEVWDRYLDDACLISTEDGRTLTKQELLAELRPLPAGYVGRIRVANAQVREFGESAVITYDVLEDLEIHGQKLFTRFHTTDTYTRRSGAWKLIASQVIAVPADPPAISLDPALYDAYVGQYALTPEVVYTVTRDGAKLYGQRTGRDRQELVPESAERFFVRGVRGVKIFARDPQGKVVRLLDRRDGNDLVWTRVEPSP